MRTTLNAQFVETEKKKKKSRKEIKQTRLLSKIVLLCIRYCYKPTTKFN